MCDPSICEFDWFIAAEGTCVGDLCVCPEGFSGNDDFVSTGSCHVNLKFAFALHTLVSISHSIGLLVSLAAVFVLRRRWSMSMGQAVGAASKQNKRRIWLRRRTIVTCELMFANCVFMLIYYIPFLTADEQISLEKGGVLQAIGYCGQQIMVFTMTSFLILSWYDTLPSVSHYGGLLKMNSVFVKYPKFVDYSCYTIIALSVIMSTIMMFVFIFQNESSDEVLAMPIFFSVFLIVFLGMFIGLATMIKTTVVKIFTLALKSMEGKESSTDAEATKKATLQRGISTAKIVCNLLIALCSFGTVQGITWLAVGGFYQYFFYASCSASSGMVVNLFPLFFVFRTNGALIPLKKETKGTQGMMTGASGMATQTMDVGPSESL